MFAAIIYWSLNYEHHGIFCSQPPLLSAMILEIYKRTGDLALVKSAFPSLLKEHHFWNSGIALSFSGLLCSYWSNVHASPLDHFVGLSSLVTGIHKVVIQDAEGCNHVMSRYYAMWNKPRPESATIVCTPGSQLTSKFLLVCTVSAAWFKNECHIFNLILTLEL